MKNTMDLNRLPRFALFLHCLLIFERKSRSLLSRLFESRRLRFQRFRDYFDGDLKTLADLISNLEK